METLNKLSPRQRPGSSLLIFLDSGIRGNVESKLVQELLKLFSAGLSCTPAALLQDAG
jgi:hypothetical protein